MRKINYPVLLARTFLLFFGRIPKYGFGHETDRQKCYGPKNTGKFGVSAIRIQWTTPRTKIRPKSRKKNLNFIWPTRARPGLCGIVGVIIADLRRDLHDGLGSLALSTQKCAIKKRWLPVVSLNMFLPRSRLRSISSLNSPVLLARTFYFFSAGYQNMDLGTKLTVKNATDPKTPANSASRRSDSNGRRPGPRFGQNP